MARADKKPLLFGSHGSLALGPIFEEIIIVRPCRARGRSVCSIFTKNVYNSAVIWFRVVLRTIRTTSFRIRDQRAVRSRNLLSSGTLAMTGDDFSGLSMRAPKRVTLRQARARKTLVSQTSIILSIDSLHFMRLFLLAKRLKIYSLVSMETAHCH